MKWRACVLKGKHMAENISIENIPDPDEWTVTVELDDGSEMDCEPLTIFDVDMQNYIVLLPVDENGAPSEEQVYIYRYYEDEKGEPSLGNIESDEEYDKVSKRFDEIQDSL